MQTIANEKAQPRLKPADEHILRSVQVKAKDAPNGAVANRPLSDALAAAKGPTPRDASMQAQDALDVAANRGSVFAKVPTPSEDLDNLRMQAQAAGCLIAIWQIL